MNEAFKYIPSTSLCTATMNASENSYSGTLDDANAGSNSEADVNSGVEMEVLPSSLDAETDNSIFKVVSSSATKATITISNNTSASNSSSSSNISSSSSSTTTSTSNNNRYNEHRSDSNPNNSLPHKPSNVGSGRSCDDTGDNSGYNSVEHSEVSEMIQVNNNISSSVANESNVISSGDEIVTTTTDDSIDSSLELNDIQQQSVFDFNVSPPSGGRHFQNALRRLLSGRTRRFQNFAYQDNQDSTYDPPPDLDNSNSILARSRSSSIIAANVLGDLVSSYHSGDNGDDDDDDYSEASLEVRGGSISTVETASTASGCSTGAMSANDAKVSSSGCQSSDRDVQENGNEASASASTDGSIGITADVSLTHLQAQNRHSVAAPSSSRSSPVHTSSVETLTISTLSSVLPEGAGNNSTSISPLNSINNVTLPSEGRLLSSSANNNESSGKVNEKSSSSAKTANKTSETNVIRNPKLKSPPGSPSSEDICAICLSVVCDACVAGSCLHRFCFGCLKEWSNQKAVCPLCKKAFTIIIHDIKGEQDYQEYSVPPPRQNPFPLSNFLDNAMLFFNRSSFLRYIQPPAALGFEHDFILPRSERSPRRTTRFSSTSESAASFRRSIYRDDLWVRFTTSDRIRESNPVLYRDQPALMHRLVPWLIRELRAMSAPMMLLDRILQLITQYRIDSRAMRRALTYQLRHQTEHFLHEFNCFAHSTYDMVGYDDAVRNRYGSYMMRENPPLDLNLEEPEDIDDDLVEIDLTVDDAGVQMTDNASSQTAGDALGSLNTDDSVSQYELTAGSSGTAIRGNDQSVMEESVLVSSSFDDDSDNGGENSSGNINTALSGTSTTLMSTESPPTEVSDAASSTARAELSNRNSSAQSRRNAAQEDKRRRIILRQAGQRRRNTASASTTVNIGLETDSTNNISVELPANTQVTLTTRPINSGVNNNSANYIHSSALMRTPRSISIRRPPDAAVPSTSGDSSPDSSILLTRPSRRLQDFLFFRGLHNARNQFRMREERTRFDPSRYRGTSLYPILLRSLRDNHISVTPDPTTFRRRANSTAVRSLSSPARPICSAIISNTNTSVPSTGHPVAGSSRPSTSTNRTTANTSRSTTITSRATARTSRATARTSRATASSNRASASTSWAKASTSRATASTSRSTASTSQATACTSRTTAAKKKASVNCDIAKTTTNMELTFNLTDKSTKIPSKPPGVTHRPAILRSPLVRGERVHFDINAETTVLVSSDDEQNDRTSLMASAVDSDECCIVEEKTVLPSTIRRTGYAKADVKAPPISPEPEDEVLVLSDTSDGEAQSIPPKEACLARQQNQAVSFVKPVKLDRESFEKNCKQLPSIVAVEADHDYTGKIDKDDNRYTNDNNCPSVHPALSDNVSDIQTPGPSGLQSIKKNVAETSFLTTNSAYIKNKSSNRLSTAVQDKKFAYGSKDHPSKIKTTKIRKAEDVGSTAEGGHMAPDLSSRATTSKSFSSPSKSSTNLVLENKGNFDKMRFTSDESSGSDRDMFNQYIRPSFVDRSKLLSPTRSFSSSDDDELFTQFSHNSSAHLKKVKVREQLSTSSENEDYVRSGMYKSAKTKLKKKLSSSDSDYSDTAKKSPSLFINVGRVVRPDISDSDGDDNDVSDIRVSTYNDSKSQKYDTNFLLNSHNNKKRKRESFRRSSDHNSRYERIVSYKAAENSSDSDKDDDDSHRSSKRIKISVSSSSVKNRSHAEHSFTSDTSEEDRMESSRPSSDPKKKSKKKSKKRKHRSRDRSKKTKLRCKSSSGSSKSGRVWDH